MNTFLSTIGTLRVFKVQCFQSSGFPRLRVSKVLGFQGSGFRVLLRTQGFSKFKFSRFKVFKAQGFQGSGFPRFRVSKVQDSGFRFGAQGSGFMVFKVQGFQSSGFSFPQRFGACLWEIKLKLG